MKWLLMCFSVDFFDYCLLKKFYLRVKVKVFNATFNNISVISWRSVLVVEETGGPRENHRPAPTH